MPYVFLSVQDDRGRISFSYKSFKDRKFFIENSLGQELGYYGSLCERDKVELTNIKKNIFGGGVWFSEGKHGGEFYKCYKEEDFDLLEVMGWKKLDDSSYRRIDNQYESEWNPSLLKNAFVINR
jgi:hypothetical protein